MNRQILRLAGPNILSNISVPLLSAVDTALMGHLDDVYFLGAVAIGSMIFNFIYWAFGFLRMGTTGLTAQAYGEADATASSRVLYQALLVAGGAALLLMALQVPIAELSFRLIEGSAEVESAARRYFYIRIWAAPATLALYAFHGWFLGLQNARFPLFLAVAVNVVNIGLSVFFVSGLGMDADGVALGTVLAQYAGLLLALWMMRAHYRTVLKRPAFAVLLEPTALRRFLNVNADIFIRTVFLVGVFTYFTAESATYGDDILAANSILLQLWNLLAYGIDGFAFAAESLVGKFIGAADRRRLKQVVRLSFLWALALGALISLLYGLLPRPILYLFTDKTGIVELAMVFMGWTIAAPLINSFCFIWDGIFIGATDSRSLRNSMIICVLLFFFPVYLLLEPLWGNHSLWLAMTLFMIVRGVSLTIYAYYRSASWIPSADAGRA